MNSDLQSVMSEKLESLKKFSFVDLRKLPPSETEKTKINNKLVYLTTWRELLSETEVRIVLQSDRNSFLGISTVNGMGFIKDNKENIYDLEPHQLGL